MTYSLAKFVASIAVGLLISLVVGVLVAIFLPVLVGLLQRIPTPRWWRDFDYGRDYAEPVRKKFAGSNE